MKELETRQIHLDFHTSPVIEGIGSEFDKDEFGDTLVKNGVNSINLFAKCHHGMYYYPTKVGTVHPHLEKDLFGLQMEACRERNIRAVAYTCVVWNEDWADRHPEWLQINYEGLQGGRPPFDASRTNWRNICTNHPGNFKYIQDEVKEIYDMYKPDGFWLDIIFQLNCVCPLCKKEMKEMGMDPQNKDDVNRHDRHVEIKFIREMYKYIKSLDQDLEVYFNSHAAEGDLGDDEALSITQKRHSMDFVDLESLPSQVWGYTHFPVNINLINHYDLDLTMMNGKFQKSWGDFGSLRNQAALEYECFRALSLGAGCCVGDQMHPNGKLDMAVYDRLSKVFKSIEKKEPWCLNTKKVANIGVFHSTEVLATKLVQMSNYIPDQTNEGIYRMLTELHIPFDFIDYHKSLEGYDLVIIPDAVRLPDDVAQRVAEFSEAGGKLIVSGSAGLNWDRTEFAIDMGLTYKGKTEYTPTYARMNENVPTAPQMDIALYHLGDIVEPNGDDVEVLCNKANPYYNRTWDRFCSHEQFPSTLKDAHPLVTKKGNTIYIAHPIFGDYADNGMLPYKQLFADMLDKIGYNYLLNSDLPSTAEVTIREKDEDTILHILHYIPMRRCAKIDLIEDVLPLYGKTIAFNTEKKVKSVTLVPQMENVPFDNVSSGIEFEIEAINGHQMVEIKFEK